ncbi:prostate and testis expressed protein 2 [Tupaia chinensis]|uniref:prostate and testis expressed protein 2 n=1 Tax=Tupaia chinensis TaxID=246437 RepID=UPI0003C8D2F6|nr:prostate and testis expressed protein 2 [Tupaia chinensis]
MGWLWDRERKQSAHSQRHESMTCTYSPQDARRKPRPVPTPTRPASCPASRHSSLRWFPTSMARLLTLLLPGTLLVLCQSPMEDPERKPVFCTSCEEFVGKTCRRSSGFCRAKHPDFMCQTRRVYTQHFTGEYLHQYSALGCPRRCAEYVRLSPGEKSTISCCNQSYCNSPTGRDGPPSTTQLRGPVQPPADRVDLRQGPGPAAH